jgi:FHA domain
VGSIREISTGLTRILEPEHVVGRAAAPGCSQTLTQPYVSAVHAVFRWTGQGWELKDLNSRNGTYLDGQRIQPAGPLRVGKGSRIGFGTRADEWEIVDAGAPEVMAVPLDGGDPVRLDGEMLGLPSSDEPSATIYRGADGGWVLEHADEPVVPLANAQVFEAVGRFWRFCCSDLSQRTLAASGLQAALAQLEIARLHLAFDVSRDEEYVKLTATCGDREFDLGAYTYHYLLLTLARHRVKDAEQGLPDTSCGWVDVEELARDPSMAPPRLNIDVFRIRDHFGRVGVTDAPKIIERRSRPRQLRIGTGHLTVKVL